MGSVEGEAKVAGGGDIRLQRQEHGKGFLVTGAAEGALVKPQGAEDPGGGI